MTKHDYIEHWKKICETEWFKNHEAVWIDKPASGIIGNHAAIISWQATASWNYGCRFIIHRQWLLVVGDIGEATFQWSEDITLEFLASLDFGYFLSKCQASPHGKKFEAWDGDVAYTNIDATQAIYRIHGINELEDIGRHSCRDDYERAARACYDRTGDAESASSIASAGMVPSTHAIGMFVGLQMAIKRLKQ